MKPDDNFSPPLDGLSRGNKLSQILTALRNSEYVQNTKYHRASKERDSSISAVIDIDGILGSDDEEERVGYLMCNWWHMSREPDWWEFSYFEIDPESIEKEEDPDTGETEIRLRITYYCTWAQQPSDETDHFSYFRHMHGDGWAYEPFETDIEAAKPLARAIIDQHLPDVIISRYMD